MLPLEEALIEVYKEKRLELSGRTERRLVLYYGPEMVASYSVPEKRWPELGEDCPEILGLSRGVETREGKEADLGIFVTLDYGGRVGPHLTIKSQDFSDDDLSDKGVKQAVQMREVILYAKDVLQMSKKYTGMPIRPDVLEAVVRDYLKLVSYALDKIKPVG